MRLAAAVPRPSRQTEDALRAARIVVLTAFGALLLGLFADTESAFVRLVAACVIAALLIVLYLTRPAVAVVATFVYLVFVAFIRRLLITDAGWTSADPLLLVGPLVSVVAMVKLFVLDKRPFVPDLLSKCIALMLFITCLEVFNPEGGIAAGVLGLLFSALPLLWYWVGRELVTDQVIDWLMSTLLFLGTVIGIYGVLQTEVGFPPWDQQWLQVALGGGYASLNVGGTLRAFGTFASAQEYALCVGAALVVAVVYGLRGRAWAWLTVPVLGFALFLSSGRAALILSFLGAVIVCALKPRKPRTALVVTIVTVGAAFGALHFAAGSLSSSTTGASALVSHQVGGLTNPLDPNNSTLLIHLNRALDGIKSSIHHPFGQGDGATNLANAVNQNSTLNNLGAATEYDITNAFVIAGPLGGALYLFIVLLVWWVALRGYFAGREALLAPIGVLVVGLGQWLIGGAYALSPLCWILIGSIGATTLYYTPATPPEPPPATRRAELAGHR